MDVEPAVVAHPEAVDVVVFARGLAVDNVFAAADDGIATGRAACAEALGFLEEPDAHLEAEIARGERAHGADVHGVERVIAVELFAGMHGNGAVAAAVNEAEDVIMRDLLHEPDAARAEHAALGVERNAP